MNSQDGPRARASFRAAAWRVFALLMSGLALALTVLITLGGFITFVVVTGMIVAGSRNAYNAYVLNSNAILTNAADFALIPLIVALNVRWESGRWPSWKRFGWDALLLNSALLISSVGNVAGQNAFNYHYGGHPNNYNAAAVWQYLIQVPTASGITYGLQGLLLAGRPLVSRLIRALQRRFTWLGLSP